MPAKKLQQIEVANYGAEHINRLALIDHALRQMSPDERSSALRYFKSRYAKEWPSNDY